MTVKEILQSLVDDGLVDTDKIGTCVYFWAFPSKASQNVSFGDKVLATFPTNHQSNLNKSSSGLVTVYYFMS